MTRQASYPQDYCLSFSITSSCVPPGTNAAPADSVARAVDTGRPAPQLRMVPHFPELSVGKQQYHMA